MDKKFCDICNKEITQFDRKFFLSYGEASKIPFMNRGKKGEICNVCFKRVNDMIEEMKRKK